ncbi:hypothetical protein K1X09_34195 [Paenibacillus lautus]|nr:hypothetical protein [Paenibacillus lautus]
MNDRLFPNDLRSSTLMYDDDMIAKTKVQLLQNKAIQDSIFSVNKSKTGYEDSSGSIFIEDWTSLSDWAMTSTPGVQIQDNKLYSTGTAGGNSGANHSYSLANNENLRAVFNVVIPSAPSSGGVTVGVSKDSPGSAPAAGGSSSYGAYFSSGGLKIMDGGSLITPSEGSTMTPGEYVVTISVDEKYISVSAIKTDGTIEIADRKLRSTFQINNLYVFNSDSRGMSGVYLGKFAARKGLQTISPRSGIEGTTKSIHWTGDGTQSFRVYLPKSYDSRIPFPVVICFHGNGTDETQWSINTNMKTVQKAFVDAGYIVLTCSLNASKTTWGNSASTNAYYEAYKFLINNYSIGSVVFYANSMGGIESLNALSENKIPCTAWIGTVPTFSLANNYQNPLFTGLIKTAYNINSDGSDYSIRTTGRDPALMNPISFQCVPMMILAPDDDVVVSKLENGDKLAETVKNSSAELVKIDVPKGGHSFSVEPYKQQMINFFNKYVGL